MSHIGTRRLERLIKTARERSHNERYSTNKGIDDPEVIGLFNDGMEHIFAEIAKRNTQAFLTSQYISLIAGTSEYSKPTRLYTGHRIENVKFNQNGDWTSNGYSHDVSGPISDEERSLYSGNPSYYGFVDNNIFFSPVPQTSQANAIKIVFRQEPNRLDIRRGVIHSDTALNSGTLQITTLKLDVAGTPLPNITDSDDALMDDYMNIVTADGAFLMRNIPITGYNSTTGVVTVRSGFTYTSGELATAGSYVTLGHNATTHNLYDKMFDAYLTDYAAFHMMQKDVDEASYQMQSNKLQAKERQILDHYSNTGITEDFIYIPGQFG